LNLAKTDKFPIKIIIVYRFTFITNEFLQTTYQRNKKVTLDEMLKIYTHEFLEGDYETRNTFPKKTEKNVFVI